MSSTTSFEPATANGHAAPEIAQPRARRPEHAQLLRAVNDDATPSGLSRSACPTARKGDPEINTTTAAAQRLSRPMRPHPYMPRRPRENRFAPNRSSVCSPPLSTPPASRTSIPRATTMTSVASSFCSGSAWQSWSFRTWCATTRRLAIRCPSANGTPSPPTFGKWA